MNKKIFITGLLVICFWSNNLFAQTLAQLEAKKVILPNGWSITPVGKQIPLGDLPLNIAISNNKKYAAITNNGQSTQTIELIDLISEKKLDTIIIEKSWYGLAFSSDSRFIYAAGGHDNLINRYEIVNNKLKLYDVFKLGKKWPNKIGPAGIELEESLHKKLFVVTREDSSLYVLDLKTKKIDHKIPLGAEAYACKLSANKKQLYISAWGREKVLIYDIASAKFIEEIEVGSNPNELLLSKNGKYLYVANANDNSVSVINTTTNKVVETLNAALYPEAPSGSTTNGLALSEDQKTLYIANADNNCLAVFDVSIPGKSKSKGFIPVGWYPTNVKVLGKKIYVTNGKGLTSYANPKGPNPTDVRQTVLNSEGDPVKQARLQYIGGLFTGTLSIINEPAPKQLSTYSQIVYKNTPYSKQKELNAPGEPRNPIPMKVGDKSPIKYVFYVIKENRTYDQVLGDVKGGNGDTSLVLFGERVTPNQHKIVKDFVLMDNFYVDAEVSTDGHNWSTAAYATDWMEKSWPTQYGQRGGNTGAVGKRYVANTRTGFIWDHCKRHNVSFRTYGEFVDKKDNPNLPVLEGHYADFTLGLTTRDTTRFYQWKKDFDSLVAINAVPQLSTIKLPADHTEGMKLGRPTPFAHVADNDLAVGLLIEHISHSPIWKESAIFILEDDAQNGPDHVDAHRSPAYVISPYVKRKSIDHTMYSTSGMLRTIELILGLPPMTQYDAAAMPMWRSFTSTPDFTPFKTLPANIDLNEKNKKNDELAKISATFNFDDIDAVPDLQFNDVLWRGIKGKPAPSPVRAAFLKPVVKADEDDD